jgi:uncharacterized LabA/DUF88 family protein
VYEDQRVGLFVDVQNMFYSAKKIYNAKLDFEKLLEATIRGRKMIRAIAYIIQSPNTDQSSFINMLKLRGYEVKSKDLRLRPDGTAKGDWDMGIAIDTISLVDKLDVAILVSGDGDFIDLVTMLKSRGVRVEVFSFPASTRTELISVATEFFPIHDDMLIFNCV